MPIQISLRRPLLTLLTLALSACGSERPEAEAPEEPVVAFDTGLVCILTARDTVSLPVELAEDETQRAHGLMERDSLPAGQGMLFTYPQPQPAESGFWMFRTRIPLDIAFVGPEGEIRSIQQMQPCTSADPRWCDSYPAGAEFQSALEVNQGFFAAHGVRPGDRVVRAGEPGCPAA